MQDKKKSKNIFVRFLEWLEKSNKRAIEKGLCGT